MTQPFEKGKECPWPPGYCPEGGGKGQGQRTAAFPVGRRVLAELVEALRAVASRAPLSGTWNDHSSTRDTNSMCRSHSHRFPAHVGDKASHRQWCVHEDGKGLD